MSSVNLERLIAEFPDDRGAVERLVGFLESRDTSSGSEKVYSINRIYDIADPSSQVALARLLRRLVQVGLLEEFIRVESEAGGIKDFSSIEEVPDELYDWRKDMTIQVRPDQLHLYYRLHH